MKVSYLNIDFRQCEILVMLFLLLKRTEWFYLVIKCLRKTSHFDPGMDLDQLLLLLF